MHKLSKKTIEMLWKDNDVPVNDSEEIDDDFCGWERFTDREEIWHWFDEQYARWGGVHALMFPDEHRKSPYGNVEAEVNYQFWFRDYAVTLETKTFDCAPALDELPLELVKRIYEQDVDADDVYYAARDIGILKEHNGPFYVVVGDCEEYITAREEA